MLSHIEQTYTDVRNFLAVFLPHNPVHVRPKRNNRNAWYIRVIEMAAAAASPATTTRIGCMFYKSGRIVFAGAAASGHISFIFVQKLVRV